MVTSNPSVAGKVSAVSKLFAGWLDQRHLQIVWGGVAWIFSPITAAFLRISCFWLTNRASYLSTLLQGPLLTKYLSKSLHMSRAAVGKEGRFWHGKKICKLLEVGEVGEVTTKLMQVGKTGLWGEDMMGVYKIQRGLERMERG